MTHLPVHHLRRALAEEPANELREVVDVRQERVVPRAALEMAVGDGLVRTHKRRRDLLRLPPRKEDVALVRNDEHLRLHPREGRVQRAIAVAGVVEVHRAGDVQVAVRVKPTQELHRLVVKVALDLEVRLEEPVTLGLLVRRRIDEVLLEAALELLLQKLTRKIGDVRELTGAGEAGPRTLPALALGFAFRVVISALPRRIVSDGITTHHRERDRLGVEVGTRRNEYDPLHILGITRHPVDHQDTAVGAADHRRELLDAELLQQQPENIDRIVEIILREGGTVRSAGFGIRGHRTCRAAATAEHVRADHVVTVGVDGPSRTDHPLPPSARLLLPRTNARDMTVTGQCVADVNRVITIVRDSALLVRNLNFLENPTIRQP